jgi:hypothetical protein
VGNIAGVSTQYQESLALLIAWFKLGIDLLWVCCGLDEMNVLGLRFEV